MFKPRLHSIDDSFGVDDGAVSELERSCVKNNLREVLQKVRKALSKIKSKNDQSEERLKEAKAKLDAKMEFVRQNIC